MQWTTVPVPTHPHRQTCELEYEPDGIALPWENNKRGTLRSSSHSEGRVLSEALLVLCLLAQPPPRASVQASLPLHPIMYADPSLTPAHGVLTS